jgi:hypothetical protein
LAAATLPACRTPHAALGETGRRRRGNRDRYIQKTLGLLLLSHDNLINISGWGLL